MNAKLKLSKKRALSLCLYCLFILFMFLVIRNKQNFHSDEISSYKLANHEASTTLFEDGKTYNPSETAWIGFMTVDSGQRFQYGNVWENQANDVHPPLYYVILHTICSLFPERFSKWFAGVINILFAVGTLYFFRKLVLLLTGDEKLKQLLSLAFITSAGILSAAGFLRMYILTMFEVTVLTYLLLRQIGEKIRWKFYAELFVCMVCGALTHYYFALYAVFISAAYGIVLLNKKMWKEAGLFCLTQGVAATVSVGIFPAMLYHVFEGSRGKESFGNLADSVSINGIGRIITFLDKLNKQLFGGIFVYIVGVWVIYILIFDIRKHKNEFTEDERKKIERYFCMLFAGILYFSLVAFSSPYLTLRYMVPIYAIIFLAMFCLPCEWMRKKFVGYLYVMIFIVTAISVNGLKNSEWEYLYRPSETLINSAREHGESDCLFIYDKEWHIQPAFYEAREYRSVTFLQEESLEMLASMDIASRSELIVIVDGRDHEILEQILDICPSLNAYEHLGTGHMYTNTYCLYP